MKIKATKTIVISLGLIMAAAGLSACSGTPIRAQNVGLLYKAGNQEGDKFDHVIEPGTGGTWVVNDKIYQLPINKRSYNACEGDYEQGCDAPEITVATKDQLAVDFSLASSFKLNTRTNDIPGYDGGTARKFLEDICRKTNCVNPDDPADEKGWDQLLKENYRPALEAAFKDVVRKFSGDDLVYNNPVPTGHGSETKPALEQVAEQVGPRFLTYLTGLMGGEYFCGPSFDRTKKATGCPPIQLLVRSAEFTNPDVRKARESVKIAKDRAEAAKLEAEGAEAARKSFGSPAQYIAYLNAQAALECAKRAENCTLVVINGSGSVSIAPK